MFRYFSQLRLRRDTPIWPIVLYMPRASEGLGFETYTETLFDEAFLPFRYWCVSLAQLSAEEYLATGPEGIPSEQSSCLRIGTTNEPRQLE